MKRIKKVKRIKKKIESWKLFYVMIKLKINKKKLLYIKKLRFFSI